ncbi:gliding motility-associated C-terminal domain-containing protein [Flavobacterium sp.]|uniref:T9SS type B sorting domain-containing protein n=1 Tax=Flavobacterium sp. TaxID=239 RepID=UPI0025D2D56A|nr:gliding motility-associated C-terminal domain-containing protein [Flavobacterium sp.]
MRITTLVEKYFIYFVLLLSLFGYNNVYSQCPTVANAAQSFCDTQSPTIASLVATNNGGGIKWYATSNSTTALSSATSLINGNIYYADDNTGTCGTRQSVTITIYSTPTGANFQGVCVTSISQATPSNPQFVISGINLKWYTTPSGGTALSNSAVLSDNTIYYISQTNPNTGCESSRLQLFVNVGLVPVPTGSAVQEFCNTGALPTVADLVASGNNNWYLTSTFGIPLDLSTPLVNGQFYYATTVDPPCESSNRLQVLVNIYEPNNAGTDGSRGICSTQISTTSPFNLFSLLGGTPDSTGVWTGPLPTSNGSQGTVIPATMTLAGSPYVFTYTVTSALCAPDTSTVTITINPIPTVTVTSTPACAGTPSTVTATPSPAGTYSYAWTVPSGATNPGNVATFSTTTAGVYSVIATNSTTTCPSQPGQTTVVINPVPDAGTSGIKTFCSNDNPQDLFLSLGGTPQSGGTWSPILVSGTGVFNPAVDVAGTYTYTVGGTCVTPSTATVTVSIITAPNSGGTGQTLNTCTNIFSFDLFTGLNGTQGTGTWNDNDATNALSNNIFNPSIVGVGTYHFTYTVIGSSPCANATSTVTVIVNPLPNSGTVVAPPSLCTSVGTVDLNTLLTGQDVGGTWSTPSPVTISNFVAGTYAYTYSVTNFCGTRTTDVQFIVLSNPVLISNNIANTAVCVGTAAVVNLSEMVDGTYALNYSLSGNNTLANQIVTIVISGGTGSFVIPAASLPNIGNTTITFNTIQDAVSTCQVTLTGIFATITVNPLVQIGTTNIAVSSICIGLNAVVEISNAVNLPDGVYQFDYTIPNGTPPLGNSGDVTIAGGVGQFTVPASVFGTTGNYTITINGITITSGCSNASQDANITFGVVAPLSAGTAVVPPSLCNSVGILDLNTLLTGQSSGGIWTDSASVVVTSQINIINFTPGTYSYSYTVFNACGVVTQVVQFIILAKPQLAGFNISVSQTCIGTNSIVNFSTMADGVYTLNYDLSGSNTLANQSVVLTIVSGIGSFTIPTTSLPNAGTTIITFTGIVNNATTCTNTLTNVTAQLIINPLVNIDNANLSIANVCFGNNIVVNIAGAINLPDGIYQFNYTIPTATPSTNTTGNVTVTAGVGQFTIPASFFTTSSNYTLTITGITTTTNCSNANVTAIANFTINPIPVTMGATISAQATCINNGSLVTISGASSLPNGTYLLTYQLTGVNTSTATVSVTFVSGSTSFNIPGTVIVNDGSSSISFNQLNSSTTCGITGTVFPSITLNVASLPTPVLTANGNLFCGTLTPAPTVANLSANIVGTPTIIWYNANTGGTAYNSTDVLVNGTIYYGTFTSASGCESVIRLAVKVDLTVCDIVIPDGFSPNNDGINDTFEIPNLAILYPNFNLEIYNRYGSLIYTGNSSTDNWGGTTTEKSLNLGNNLLPTGVYFYILNFNDGIKKPIQGRVYLNR